MTKKIDFIEIYKHNIVLRYINPFHFELYSIR